MTKISLKNCKGSFTVEAAIIFFTVFVSIIALIYTCQLLYRQALLQTIASKTAQRGAVIWNNESRDMLIMQILPVTISVLDLYKDIFRSQVDFVENTQKINNYISLIKGDETSLQGKGISVKDPEIISELIYDRLRITVYGKSRLPAGNILRMFGLKDEIILTATSEAMIHSTSDFIRNTDLVIETMNLDGISGSQLAQYIPEVVKKFGMSYADILDMFK